MRLYSSRTTLMTKDRVFDDLTFVSQRLLRGATRLPSWLVRFLLPACPSKGLCSCSIMCPISQHANTYPLQVPSVTKCQPRVESHCHPHSTHKLLSLKTWILPELQRACALPAGNALGKSIPGGADQFCRTLCGTNEHLMRHARCRIMHMLSGQSPNMYSCKGIEHRLQVLTKLSM